MLRFFLVFSAVLSVLFVFQLIPLGQTWIVTPWTSILAQLGYLLISPFDPDVIAHGKVIQSRVSGQGISIEAGCNAIEASIVLIAAIVAFPCAWRHKLAGLGLGLVAVQGVNVLRVISLFYLAQWRADVFEFVHVYLWQALIMLDVLMVWLVWVRAIATRRMLLHGS